MNPIWFVHRQPTAAVTEIIGQLSAHFGAGTVAPCERAGESLVKEDVMIVLLSKPADSTSAGLPLDDLEAIANCGVQQALQLGATVIPVLLDGAVMPDHRRLPEPIRCLAFQHALLVRTGNDLPRDVGRLIKDLEVHLRRAVGQIYPWDWWLLPVGVGATLFGMYAGLLWYLELTLRTHGYHGTAPFETARRALAVGGGLALGLGMVLVAAAVCWRQFRYDTLQRAAHYRTGTGILPPGRNPLAVGCFCLGAAALGWGWWSAIPALILGLATTYRPRRACHGRDTKVLLLLGVVGGLAGSAWMLYQQARVSHFRSALAAYEAGQADLKTEQPLAAELNFQRAIDHYPRFGHPYYQLGRLHDQAGKPNQALSRLEEASERYPRSDPGLWDPSAPTVAEAYQFRAQIHARLGQQELAEEYRKLATEVNPNFNLFGGFFRYWE